LPHVAALLELLDELRSEQRIDARRVYIVGQSLGGAKDTTVLAARSREMVAALRIVNSSAADVAARLRHTETAGLAMEREDGWVKEPMAS
jgi:poly(3-hydroxybutyrate) depolymerase